MKTDFAKKVFDEKEDPNKPKDMDGDEKKKDEMLRSNTIESLRFKVIYKLN